MPELKDPDVTTAFIDRVVLLYFPHSIPRKKWDTRLSEKLLYEKNEIFTLALREMSAIFNRNFLDYKKFQPKKCKRFLEDYERRTTRVPRFFAECCERVSDKKFTTTNDLYKAYLNYYRIKKGDSADKCIFSKTFAQLLGYSSKNVKNKQGNAVKGYYGVKIKKKFRVGADNKEI